MGAQQTGCGACSDLPCCSKNGKDGDIVRAKPMAYPGMDGSENRKAHLDDSHRYNGIGDSAPMASTAVASAHREPGTVEGEETYEDGSTYEGELSGDNPPRRHGRGVWKSATEQYSGQWKNDQRDGQGRQTWQDGRVYEGQFKIGKFDGHGRMEWHMPAGLMTYEGQYIDDLKHGHGRYTWPDNRVYDGQWSRGQRSGKGIYINSLGQKREGVWKEDRVEKWLCEDGTEDTNAS